MASVIEFAGRLRAPVTTRLVVVTLVAVRLVGLKSVAAKVVNEPLVLVTDVSVSVEPDPAVKVRPVVLRLVEVTLVKVLFVPVRLVAKRLVLVALVKTPVDGVLAPIGVLSIVPPLMVRAFTTMASVMELAGRFKTPDT